MTIERSSIRFVPESSKPEFEGVVILLDEKNLDPQIFWQKYKAGKLSQGCMEYMKWFERIMDLSPVSTFFKTQVVFESGIEYKSGINKEESPYEKTRTFFISCAAHQEYIAREVEIEFFGMILSLLKLRERMGIFNPVKWQEWEEYLKKVDKKVLNS